MPTPILECRDLTVTYRTRLGSFDAVRHFDCVIAAGEAHGLVGESGCGKSSIAMAIMRHLGRNGAISQGTVLYDGRDMATMDARELRATRGGAIGMVYQEPMSSLNPSMQIGAQLCEMAALHGDSNDARARAESMLTRVRLPDTARMMRSYPHQLSGGQQQRVVIAMALLGRPRLLLLDEPTTALDVTIEAGIMDLIGSLSRELGLATLQISHNLGLIAGSCDVVTVMYAGEAVETGRVDDVFAAPRHPYTRGLLASIASPAVQRARQRLAPIRGQLPSPGELPSGCAFAPRCDAFQAGTCDSGPIEMTTIGPGRASRCARVADIAWDAPVPATALQPAGAAGAIMLVAHRVTKRYAGDAGIFFSAAKDVVVANDRLSLQMRRGETLAIVGESGCGKSTFAKIVVGLEEADEGSLLFDGADVARQPVRRRSPSVIARLQMIFQNPAATLNPSRTVGAQLSRAVAVANSTADAAAVAARVRALLDLVKLPRSVVSRLPQHLSGGQKQRVAIARAFAGEPELVVADEPLSALDVSVQAAITQLLIAMQRERSATLLFISHDLAVVRYLADRVVVLYLGQVVETGTAEEIFAPPYHPYTEGLLAAIPLVDPAFEKRQIIVAGEIPSQSAARRGCPFVTRCAYAIKGRCEEIDPPLRRFSENHVIACHLEPEILAAIAPVFAPATKATAEA